MHPRIAEMLDYIDRERVGLGEAVESLPAEHRSRRPAPERWSAAEVVEHLVAVDRRIVGVFTTMVASARDAGAQETSTVPLLPTMNTAKILDRSSRFVSRTQSETGDIDVASSLARLDAIRAEMRMAILEGDGLDLASVAAPHPAFGPMSMYEWMAFVGAHTGRHADQIRENGRVLAAD